MKFSLITLFRTLTLRIRSGQAAHGPEITTASALRRSTGMHVLRSRFPVYSSLRTIVLSSSPTGLSGGTLLARSGPAAVSAKPDPCHLLPWTPALKKKQCFTLTYTGSLLVGWAL
jgi:hypothetical protein